MIYDILIMNWFENIKHKSKSITILWWISVIGNYYRWYDNMHHPPPLSYLLCSKSCMHNIMAICVCEREMMHVRSIWRRKAHNWWIGLFINWVIMPKIKWSGCLRRVGLHLAIFAWRSLSITMGWLRSMQWEKLIHRSLSIARYMMKRLASNNSWTSNAIVQGMSSINIVCYIYASNKHFIDLQYNVTMCRTYQTLRDLWLALKLGIHTKADANYIDDDSQKVRAISKNR